MQNHSRNVSVILRNDKLKNEYKLIFDQCDRNKDGYISLNELKLFVENNENVEMPERLVKNVHDNFDKNNDNRLDFDEFLDMVNHPKFAKVFKRIGSRYMKFAVVTSIRNKDERIYVRQETRTGLYEEEFRCEKYSFCMLVLSLVQILLFYVSSHHHEVYEALSFDPKRRREYWRYFTYIFIHADAYHLYPNIIIQLVIGIPLELVHQWRVIVIYVAGAYGGCLAFSVMMSDNYLIGGSGGFYAFYTAHIATVIMNWREMSHPVVQLLIFSIVTIFDPVQNYLFKDNSKSQTSYVTHLGGAVVGLLLGVNILRNLKVTNKERVLWWICIVAYVLLMVVYISLDLATNVF